MHAEFRRVKEIFLAAVEKQDAAARDAYVRAACGPDEDVRRQVDALLGQHAQAGSFLEPPARSPVVTVDEQPVREGPGTVIGPYKLLEQIGEGGFGVVFMAEQVQPVRRKVALKVIKPGMDSRQTVARFEAERQALALMDHPNIAKVFDAGTTESGRPYFVMELVKGTPVTQFCDDNRLTPRERLELFTDVCQAVQHAHQKGIIHRDLKPSNILVVMHDTTPVPKVIDFGIAKALGQELTDKTLFTGFAQMVGTPLYMSPEQAGQSGLDIDTRTDVYALGVLLYELLTGTTPFDKERLRTAGFDEIRRIIREEEPPKPSTRMSTLGQAAATASDNRRSDPRKLGRLLRGELDWVVMKALEKDRNRRYESASAFAADVQRYLNDEPVQACPPSPWYRFRKFARRHRAAWRTAAAVAAAVLLAVTALAVSYAQIREEQKQTKEEQRKTQEALQREQLALYYQRIALAERELTGNNLGRAQELLDLCPPQLRGWEWYYLKRRCQAEPLTIPTHERQTGGGFDLAFSPNSRYLAVPTDSKNVQVWDLPAGQAVRTLRGHKGRVWAVAFSPDGRLLASASADKRVMVWDLTTNPAKGEDLKPLFILRGHKGPVGGVTFSPDGKRLASASTADAVKLWDVTTGKQLHHWPAPRPRSLGGWFAVAAFSPGGEWLASGAGEHTVKVWEVATGREVCTLRGHAGPVSTVAFSRDGQRLVSKSQDASVRIWDLATGREAVVASGRHSNGTWCAALSPDGRLLAVGGGHTDGAVRLHDAATGELVHTLQGHIERVVSVAFSPDGKRLASAGLDKHVKLWDPATGQEVLTLRGHTDVVWRVLFSPDGRRLASASGDGTVRVWDATPAEEAPDPRTRTLRGHAGIVYGVAFSPGGRHLASASADKTVKVWEAATGKEVRNLRGHTDKVLGVAFIDKDRLASASMDRTVRLWDVWTGQQILPRLQLQAAVRRVARSPDGQLLATCDHEHNVQVWDTRTGKLVRALPGPLGVVWRVAFSPDGKWLATASASGAVKVWDVATGKELQTFQGHSTRVFSVAFSPDGRTLASGDTDWKVKLWEAATAKEVRTLSGHTDYVFDLAFSPNRRHLASASWAEVKIWDWTTGKEVRTLSGHAGTIWGVAFSPDGRRLAAASGYKGKGEIKIWDATVWESQAGGGRKPPE
jgi:WD40 repeat protein/serine/threonine protein kinase